MNPSTRLARVLVDELIANGVTDAVLCPGSRNAPLSMALHDADLAGRLRLHVRIDERTAGFLAVGLARGSGRPAAVCTTSGTAVANLHPAVLESHHGGVPLILLTADRPPWLRDVGANQTVDQRLFGPVLRFFHEYAAPGDRADREPGWRAVLSRAIGLARGGAGGLPGPVQLNVPLVEPLLPGTDGESDPTAPDGLSRGGQPWTRLPSAPTGAAIAAPAPGERVLFVADLCHPAAGALADAGAPVVSEAGGAAGARVLSAGLHLLANPEFLARHLPERVVVLGRPTLHRQIARLLADPEITVDVVAQPAGYADPAGRVRAVAPALEPLDTLGDADFVAAWQLAQRQAAAAVAETVASFDLSAGPRLAAELVAGLPAEATLLLGASQPPRDVGSAAAARSGVRVVANRGVAGIDGTVSTAVGVALTAATPTVALLGDLTLLHDTTGLLIGPHEPRPDLVLVVANNDGGGIFTTLEPGLPAHARAFERVFGTPVGVAFADLARAVGAEHELVVSADELADTLAAPGSLRIVEVPVSRTELAGQHRLIRQAAAAAVR